MHEPDGPGNLNPPLFMANRIIQMAWVVPDLERAMRAWINTNGVGPFFVAPLSNLVDELDYRGQAVNLPETDVRLALAQAGDMQVELVEQRCATPSFYRELVPAGRAGLHHVAIIAKDYDREIAAYEERGFGVATRGALGDVRWSYLDTGPTLGCATELLEANPLIDGFFNMVRDAAKDWDGRDPIRTLA